MGAKQKKSQKAGRNIDECKAYRLSAQRERNKIVKLEKHLKRFPEDDGAKKALEACRAVVR